MEITELKNTITKIKSKTKQNKKMKQTSLDDIQSRNEMTEDRIGRFENRLIEFNQSEQQRERGLKQK